MIIMKLPGVQDKSEFGVEFCLHDDVVIVETESDLVHISYEDFQRVAGILYNQFEAERMKK